MMNIFEQQDMSEVLNVDGGKDRISSLPDCILHYILSFLPTKEAVATGILAKRWKDLWTAVPIVDFDDSLLYTRRLNVWYAFEINLFMNFVERVLLLRDASIIERFRLSCRVCFSPSRVHAWISAAVRHKVQELDLCLFVDNPFSLPHCVLNCGSLTVLKLEMNCVLQLPCSICMPGLKIMHLGLVIFSDDRSTQRLLSCCPVLEELEILDCDWMNLRSIVISITSLKSLVIDDLPIFDSGNGSSECEIKINAENLIVFKYSGYLSNEMHLSNVSSLVNASLHISMPCQTENRILYCRLLNLFHGLKNICSLCITSSTLEYLLIVDDMQTYLPELQKLVNLELSMLLVSQAVGALIKFLGHLPKLEYLNFLRQYCATFKFGSNDSVSCNDKKLSFEIQGLNLPMRFVKDEWVPKSSSKHFLSSLRMVDFQNFHGHYAEVSLLQILLDYAVSLEKINMFCCKNPLADSDKQEDMRNHWQSLPSVSKSCVMAFF